MQNLAPFLHTVKECKKRYSLRRTVTLCALKAWWAFISKNKQDEAVHKFKLCILKSSL